MRVLLAILLIGVMVAKAEGVMKISSSEFADNGLIPKKYTCDGENISPPLAIEDIPEGTKSLALIVDDPDAPMGTWVHWVVFDIEVVNKIAEDTIPGKQGINDFHKKDYGGPCPPSGTHRYFFKIYALDAKLGSEEGIKKEELEEKMKGHIIQEARLIGLYKR